MLCRDLGELVEISIGRTPSRNDDSLWDISKNGHNVWLSIADLIVSGKEVFESKEYISDKAAASFAVVPKGTLLVSFKLTLGRIAFAGTDLRTNEAIAALRNDEAVVTNDYLYWYLQHFNWKQYASADQKVKGLTLNKEKLKKLPVYYPESKDVQRKIVSKLDAEFDRISRTEKLLKENLENVDKLQKSILSEAFKFDTDTHTHRFCEIVDPVKVPSKIQKKEYLSAGLLPIISQEEDYINGYWDNEKDKIVVAKPVIVWGDHTRIIKFVNQDFVAGADGTKVFLPHNNIDTKWLYYWMQANPVKSLGYARHYRLLKEMTVDVPDMDAQLQCAKKVDNSIKKIKALKDGINKELSSMQGLRNRVLAEAFSL